MKKRFSVILLIVSLFVFPVFSACDYTGYKGPHVDLFSVTSNSILGVWGDADPIIILEEDDYGRKMFFHWGSSIIAEEKDDYEFWAIVICQQTDSKGKYTYFYSDVNYILFKVAFPDEPVYGGDLDRLKEIAYTLATDKEINDFKLRNDWDKPINEAKCVKVKVSRAGRGIDDSLISRSKKETICNYLRPGSARGDWADYYLTSDIYNRHIFFFKDMKNEEYQYSYLLMLFPDGSYHAVKLNDPWNFQEELKRFKLDNNWNTPIKNK